MADESMRSIADLRDGAALCFAIAEAVAVEDDDVATWQNTIKFLEGSLVIAKQHHAEFVKTAAMSGSAGDNLSFTLPKTTCISPKGKLDIDFGDYNVTITGKDFVVTTPYTNVDALLKLPRHNAVSKTKVASYEFVLRLEKPVSYRKSTLKYIAFDVSATSAVISNENILLHDAVLENDTSLTQAKLHAAVQMQLQKHMSHIRVIAEPTTGNRRYVSTHGESFVKCYRKTTSGHLFFLPEGLCFLNPPLFLSRSEVDAIETGRKTSLHLRSFDLVVDVVDGPSVEFSMVEKEEMPSITEFVNMFKVLKDDDARDAPTESTGDTQMTQEEDSEEDDSDFVMGADSDDSDDDYDDLSGSAYSEDSDSETDMDVGIVDSLAAAGQSIDDDDEGPLGPFPDQGDMDDI